VVIGVGKNIDHLSQATIIKSGSQVLRSLASALNCTKRFYHYGQRHCEKAQLYFHCEADNIGRWTISWNQFIFRFIIREDFWGG